MKNKALTWYCPRCFGEMEEEREPGWFRCADCGERVYVDKCKTLGEKIELLRG